MSFSSDYVILKIHGLLNFFSEQIQEKKFKVGIIGEIVMHVERLGELRSKFVAYDPIIEKFVQPDDLGRLKELTNMIKMYGTMTMGNSPIQLSTSSNQQPSTSKQLFFKETIKQEKLKIPKQDLSLYSDYNF